MNITISFAQEVNERFKDIELLKKRVQDLNLVDFRVKDIRPMTSERKQGYWHKRHVTLSNGPFLMALVRNGVLEVVRKETVESKVEEPNYGTQRVFVDNENGNMFEYQYELENGKTYTIKDLEEDESIIRIFKYKINVYQFTENGMEDYKTILIDSLKEQFANELERL